MSLKSVDRLFNLGEQLPGESVSILEIILK